MTVKNCYKIILLICGLILIVAYYLLVNTNTYIFESEVFSNVTESSHEVREKSLPKYLIWTPQCKILDLDAWDASIRKYVNPVKSVKFEQISPLVKVVKREINQNVLKIQEVNDKKNCCYSVITRKTQKYGKHNAQADKKVSISNCRHIENETTLSNTTEFIYVKCIKNSKKIYENIHAIVPILPRVADRIENFTKHNLTKKLNILLVGIDSLSRLALQRLMPDTVKYFQQKEWVELKGFNKIGPNTFPNLLGVITGRNSSVNYNICTTIDPKKKEPCRIIWDDYKENGYVTAYAEDFPRISTFNYHKTGFVTQPTDYYLRPFLLAGEELFKCKIARGHPVGFGPISYIDALLNYGKEFVEKFIDYNFFGLFWMNSYSHDDNDLATAMDSMFKNFLSDLETIGAYENTLVIAFSDHGARFGKLRKTTVGYYEERLPFIYFWVPQWYRDMYPEKYKNLLINQNRLTTPYDVYVTIYKLLNENGTSDACPNCQSLFEEIPESRSCEDAAITKEWCMCSDFKEVNTTDPLITQVGQFLYWEVEITTQSLLKKFKLKDTLCQRRQLINVKRGFESFSTNGKKDGEREFVVVIETQPGPATFEAKIKVRHNNITGNEDMKLVNSISRLDSYASVSQCVEKVDLKYFCHCR